MLRLLYNQKTNWTNNHNPCLHCFQRSLNKNNFENEVFIIRTIKFSDIIFKESWSSDSSVSN